MPEENIEFQKIDFMLKFKDEAEMMSALEVFMETVEKPVLDENGEYVLDENNNPVMASEKVFNRFTKEYAIDVIGLIYKETDNMITDSENFEYAEMAPIDGWHVNFRLIDETRRNDIESVASIYAVDPEPTTPYRVWI